MIMAAVYGVDLVDTELHMHIRMTIALPVDAELCSIEVSPEILSDVLATVQLSHVALLDWASKGEATQVTSPADVSPIRRC